MDEIFPGVFHWSTFHAPIGSDVSSYFVVPAGVVIDPKVPAGGYDVLPGRPTQVALTSGHHRRDSEELAAEFDIPIRASKAADEHMGGEVPVKLFTDGDEIAAGVTALEIGVLCPDEGALHVAVGGGAIAIADGINPTDGTLGFFPDGLLGDDPEAVKDGLRKKYAELLDRDFDHLLFAHGDPIVGGGKQLLTDFVQD
jgi:hypothetical protein